MGEVGYEVLYYSSSEFAFIECAQDEADDIDRWFPTFTEAKKWAVEAVSHDTYAYRSLLRSVRSMRKSDASKAQTPPHSGKE